MNNNYLKATIFAIILGLTTVVSDAQLRTQENVPVGFYGKVVDQDGRAVAGANVSLDFIVSHMDEDRTETKPFTMQTDQDGKFELTGVIGYGIDKFVIQKDGYQLSKKTLRSYVFGHKTGYKPNHDSPVIFRMWKEAGKEQLVGSSWHGKVACNGTTNRFDLFHGRRSADGSLEIVCTRVPLNLPPANTAPFTWNVQITVVGGAIQPTNDEFTYLAPETGYLPLLTYGQQANDPKWDRQMPMPKDYYIKTSDGHYGHLSLEWDRAFWQSPMIVKWDCSVNPSGSRNLER